MLAPKGGVVLQPLAVSSESPGRATAAHVIVVGNEKGGAGKSTLAMHLTIALLKAGRRVGVFDLDLRQKSLTRYLDNRRTRFADPAAFPYMVELGGAPALHPEHAAAQERAAFAEALLRAGDRCEFLIVDAPGSDTPLGRLAHAHADTLITPLNDSFVDFDLLADFDPRTNELLRPGVYAELVWDSRKRKAAAERRPIDWVVLRNRMATGIVEAKNSQRVAEALKTLSNRIGFRIAPGLAERVIYRELFPMGATLLDLGEGEEKSALKMSHIAARQELRDLLIVLKLPGLSGAQLGF